MLTSLFIVLSVSSGLFFFTPQCKFILWNINLCYYYYYYYYSYTSINIGFVPRLLAYSCSGAITFWSSPQWPTQDFSSIRSGLKHLLVFKWLRGTCWARVAKVSVADFWCTSITLRCISCLLGAVILFHSPSSFRKCAPCNIPTAM